MYLLLDLYCGAGGAAAGYNRAGYEVIGVDIKPQPDYPFEFIQSDVCKINDGGVEIFEWDAFDLIHASPPCQAYSFGTAPFRNKGKKYPDLLGNTRELLVATDRPYVIENVQGAPLINPLMLCGTMFNLRVLRHRFFEINSDAWVYPPCGCNHIGTTYGGDYCSVYKGGRPGVWGEREKVKMKGTETISEWREAMGIDWMTTKYELTQAIPPVYTEWIGKLIRGSE
jgi:DNA (cytosine-5)-methyltransferase 1